VEGGHRRVVAAGNLGRHAATQGYATIAVPGNDPFVITVKPDQPLPKQPQAQPVPQPASEDHLDAGSAMSGKNRTVALTSVITLRGRIARAADRSARQPVGIHRTRCRPGGGRKPVGH